MQCTGVSEPSEALIDVCVGMYESNVLKYVEWSKCTSREQELSCDSKKDIRLTIDPDTSRLKVEAKTKQLEADASSEVLVMQALQRRALALDQANVVDFLVLDAWHQKMLRARLAVPPPGFMQVSFRQMIHADQRLFLELSDLTRAGIQATAAGRPTDAQVPIASALHEVMCLLQPLPLAGQAGRSARLWDKGDQDRPLSASCCTAKGKGAGKGKFSPVPTALRGAAPIRTKETRFASGMGGDLQECC